MFFRVAKPVFSKYTGEPFISGSVSGKSMTNHHNIIPLLAECAPCFIGNLSLLNNGALFSSERLLKRGFNYIFIHKSIESKSPAGCLQAGRVLLNKRGIQHARLPVRAG